MSKAFDAAKYGSRIAKRLRKDPKFVERVARNRDYKDPYNFVTNSLEWDCVGPCIDEDGNPVWIQNRKDPVTMEDLVAIMDGNSGSFVNPLDLLADEERMVRNPGEYNVASALVNGSGVEDLDGFENWYKFQRVDKDGNVLRVIKAPSSKNYDKKSWSVSRNKGRNGVVEKYGSEMYGDKMRYSVPNSRKSPYRYFGKRLTYPDKSSEKFLFNPKKVPAEYLRHPIREWGFKSWNLKPDEKGNYDISDKIGGEMLSDSRYYYNSPGAWGQYKDNRDQYRYSTMDPYYPKYSNMSRPYEYGGDPWDSYFMSQTRNKLFRDRMHKNDAKWDKELERRSKEYADVMQQFSDLDFRIVNGLVPEDKIEDAVMKRNRLEAMKDSLWKRVGPAKDYGSEREAELEAMTKHLKRREP